jgi:6-phosphogluconolactonase
MIIVVMGVAGSGKTTIGTMLAAALACEYLEGDSLHPADNIAAMSQGIALTDADRAQWLAAIHARLVAARADGRSLVVGCSALKESYRRTLSAGVPITWVYLRGSTELIRQRLRQRSGHFFEAALLDSQVEALEEPGDAIIADVSLAPPVLVDHILTALRTGHDVRIAADPAELGERVAGALATAIRDTVVAAGRCSLVLSGGATPRGLHRVLATRCRDEIPWASVQVFWSDERYVPAADARSNYRMARETLLDHVPCPPGNVHPMPTSHADPADAARAYEATLEAWFDGAPPRFDVAILGMGADGHTASLFPRSPALREQTRWVLAVTAAAEPPERLTLTLPVLTAAARSWVLVSGTGKAATVRRVLSGSADPRDWPAASLHDAPGRLTWWLDRDAASQLDTKPWRRTPPIRDALTRTE